MAAPVLHDAVTLRHFAVAERLDLLEALHGDLPHPRWTAGVFEELMDGMLTGCEECHAVLDAQHWLGSPQESPSVEADTAIQRLRRALGGKPGDLKERGEAESIYFAGVEGGVVATDDFNAFDFAQGHLGDSRRAIDTVDILRACVAAGLVTADGAVDICERIRLAGRHLRAGHPEVLTADYFLPHTT